MIKIRKNVRFKILGIAMAITGGVIVIHTIPLIGWYIILIGLVFALFIIIYWGT